MNLVKCIDATEYIEIDKLFRFQNQMQKCNQIGDGKRIVA